MPWRLVMPHSTEVQAMCFRRWSAGGSGKKRSKPSGVESASFGSALAFPCRDGYREPIQKNPQSTAMTHRVIGIRKSKDRLAPELGAGKATWGLVMVCP